MLLRYQVVLIVEGRHRDDDWSWLLDFGLSFSGGCRSGNVASTCAPRVTHRVHEVVDGLGGADFTLLVLNRICQCRSSIRV